ncbi:MAG: glycosyltransferase family 2 protein [Candidatus Thermoplasmatota archaeon]
MAAAVSVLIVTHNSAAWIAACLASIPAGLDGRRHEVVVCDNASTDGTSELVARLAPRARVVRQANLGYGAGVNRAAREATGELLVVLNPDTVAESGSLARLADAAVAKTIAIPTITLLADPERVNTCGLDLHFTGLATVRGLGDPADDWARQDSPGGFSGAAFAMRRHDFQALGGFDDAFFLYLEDVDLAWRARRNGFAFVHVGDARVRHDYRFQPGARKLGLAEEGRLILLRRHFAWWHWLAYAPSLLAVEVLAWGQAVRFGPKGLAAKGRAVRRGWRRLPPRPATGRLAMSAWATRRVRFANLGAGPVLRALLAPLNALFWLNTLAWRRRPKAAGRA